MEGLTENIFGAFVGAVIAGIAVRSWLISMMSNVEIASSAAEYLVEGSLSMISGHEYLIGCTESIDIVGQI